MTGNDQRANSTAFEKFLAVLPLVDYRAGATILKAGEISALLDQPHSADVRTLENSQFRVADAAQLANNPHAMLYLAKNLAQRLVACDDILVQLRKELDNELALSTL
jgi:CRP-like cAMP-binding protein